MRKRKRRKRKSARERIRARARQQTKLPDKLTVSKEVLENNTTFNLELDSDSPLLIAEAEHFIKVLTNRPLPKGFTHPIKTGPKRERKSWRNVRTLLANIHVMLDTDKETIAYSRSGNTYSHRAVSGGIISLIDLAVKRRLLQTSKGFFKIGRPRSENRLSRMWPTDRLLKLLDSDINSEDLIRRPDDVIELRKTVMYTVPGKPYHTRKKKVFVPKAHWPKLTAKKQKELDNQRSALGFFHLVLNDYKITYRDDDGKRQIIKPPMKIIYTDDFEHGGRFYTRRDGHQQLSKEQRATIRFSGHRTQELDFGGLHIRMLYHLEGRNYSLNADPYEAVLKAIGKNPRQLKRLLGKTEYDNLRDDLKKMLLAIICGTIKSKNPMRTATRRANYRLFKSWKDKKKPEAIAEAKELCEDRLQRWKKADLLNRKQSCLDVVKAFYEAHKPIRKNFYTGIGKRLQNIDAQIVLYVMLEMAIGEKDYCIPVLPVHDSFITFRESRCIRKLSRVMKEVYNDVMQKITKKKRAFHIPVKL